MVRKIIFLAVMWVTSAVSAQDAVESIASTVLLSSADISRVNEARDRFGGSFGQAMTQERYRNLFPDRFPPDCESGQRVFPDGVCEVNQFGPGGPRRADAIGPFLEVEDDTARLTVGGSSDFEMRCQRESFDRDADIVGSSGNLFERTIHKEVTVRLREHRQRLADDASRVYLEIDGQRIEVGRNRNFNFRQCRVTRTPQVAPVPRCAGQSLLNCAIDNIEVDIEEDRAIFTLQF